MTFVSILKKDMPKYTKCVIHIIFYIDLLQENCIIVSINKIIND